MLKIIYVAICVLNILMLIELSYKVAREIKKNNLHRIKSVSLFEKVIAIVKFLIFALTPILNLIIFFVELISLNTEDGLNNYLDKTLEDYE